MTVVADGTTRQWEPQMNTDELRYFKPGVPSSQPVCVHRRSSVGPNVVSSGRRQSTSIRARETTRHGNGDHGCTPMDSDGSQLVSSDALPGVDTVPSAAPGLSGPIGPCPAPAGRGGNSQQAPGLGPQALPSGFAGWPTCGRPRTTLRRGKRICSRGRVVRSPLAGAYATTDLNELSAAPGASTTLTTTAARASWPAAGPAWSRAADIRGY